MKRKAPSVSKLKKQLDVLFSRWVRLKNADRFGYVFCFTCGARHPWKNIQAGHYVPRNVGALRYSDLNVHPQCLACNVFQKGRMDVYAIKLERKYGDGILQKLNTMKQKPFRFSTVELQRMLNHYKSELEAIT